MRLFSDDQSPIPTRPDNDPLFVSVHRDRHKQSEERWGWLGGGDGLPLHPNRAQSRLKPGEPLPLFYLCDKVVAYLVYAFAIYTLLYHVGNLGKISLFSLSLVFIFVLIAFSVAFFYFSSRSGDVSTIGLEENRVLAPALLFISLACACLALLTIRPDPDDIGYLSRAVYNFEHYMDGMRLEQPFAFVSEANAKLFFILPSYEHLNATVALVLGVTPIQVYHFIAPIVGGALLPVVWYHLLRRFSNSGFGALLGALAVTILLCVDGTVHRSPGNLALVRIWQGKALLLTIITPICVGYLTDAILHGRRFEYVRLVALSIASVGLTLTSFFYLPFLGVASGIALFVVYFRHAKFRNLVIAGASLASYLLLWAIPSYFQTQAVVSSGNAIRVTPFRPTDFIGDLSLVFGPFPGISLLAALGSLAIIWIMGRRYLFLWLVLWSAIILVPRAIPITSYWIVEHLTSEDAYWRVNYTLPVGLSVGLGVMSIVERFSRLKRLWFFVSLTGVFLAVLAGFQNYGISPWAKPNVSFPELRLKMPRWNVELATILIDKLAPGPMLSAYPVSMTLPVFTSIYPQCAHRGFFLERIFDLKGLPEVGVRRVLAQRYASGADDTEEGFEAFSHEILYPYRYVIVPPNVAGRPKVMDCLKRAGFEHVANLSRILVILEKTGSTKPDAPY
jgi:hypothetical protein